MRTEHKTTTRTQEFALNNRDYNKLTGNLNKIKLLNLLAICVLVKLRAPFTVSFSVPPTRQN